MPDPSPEVHAAHKEMFDRNREVSAQRFMAQVEFAKEQISFMDKLVVLCGATLALSFTAAATFANRAGYPAVHRGAFLTTGWVLLVLSIVFALLCSVTITNGMLIRNEELYCSRLRSNRYIADITARALGMLVDPCIASDSEDTWKRQVGFSILYKFYNQLYAVFAFLALFNYISAVCFLFGFLHANIWRH